MVWAGKETWDLIVIGGGAAGLWAAGTAAQRSLRVLVLEKNKKPGVKILMSGGTRCNLTHHCGIEGILRAFGAQGRFLKSAVHGLPPEAVVSEINRLGVATKVEETGKVFPVSDRAMDVRDALVRRLREAGAVLQSGVAVEDIRRDKEGWCVTAGGAEIPARNILLCCGGLSYAGCGTTGDGYAWAKKFGHNIVPTAPALTPLLSPAAWVHELQGLTLADVAVRVVIDNKIAKDPRGMDRGGFLWTHFGCSGPVPMNLSRFISRLESKQSAALEVDFLPDRTEEEVRMSFDPSQSGKRGVVNVLQSLIPKSLAQTLAARAQLAEGVTLAELSRKGRQTLIQDLKRLQLPLAGTRGYAKAEVTQGGVDTREVNPRTMESRLISGLYFAGEILDIDGPIGGYNFQAAFSTGHSAGLSVPAKDAVA